MHRPAITKQLSSRSDYATALTTVTYTNTNNLNPGLGHREVNGSVNDGDASSNVATSIIDVGGTNDSPESINDAAAVQAGEAITITSQAGLTSNDTDPESDPITVVGIRTGSEYESGVSSPAGTTLTGSLGVLTVTADGSYHYNADQTNAKTLAEGATEVDIFTYTISDGTDQDEGQLTITVTGTNDPPEAGDDSQTVRENASIEISSTAGVLNNDSDADGDDLTITAVQSLNRSSNRQPNAQRKQRSFRHRSHDLLERNFGELSSPLPSLTGLYGQLTLNADGSYAYEANQAAADALHEGMWPSTVPHTLG